MAIHHYGQIGAGKVVPFSRAAVKTEIVAVPTSILHLKPMKFQICGDSFADEGVADGTMIIARETFERHELTPGRLCIVRVCGSEDSMKRVYQLANGEICLRAGNRAYPDKIYAAEMVEIVALVEAEWRVRK